MSPEPIGSFAEEAAKLVSALSSLQQGGQHGPDSSADDTRGSDDPAGSGASGGTHDAHDPLSPECRYCPLCALARAARSMTPEVRDHLASAASSLLLAARGLLDEALAAADRRTDTDDAPVEKIDLAED
jgi:hypothetical protein